MSVLPLDVDYTARDFDSLKDRLTRGIKRVFPQWTDFNQANFGIILLESLCFVGDVLNVYEDGDAREAFLSTCVRRISALRHTRRLGYTMRGQTAAQVDLQFTLRQTYSNDVVFPAGSICRSPAATDPARVQLLTDLTILGGNLQGTVTAEHSLSHEEVFDSDDTADQEFELGQTPFLEVASITDEIGTFAKVDNFLDSVSTDLHFVVLVSEDNRALIRFGDGQNGQVPTGQITVSYKTGGGEISIEAGTITVPEFTVTDGMGTTVLFDVTNPSAGSGGLPQESIAEARVEAPASIAIGNRTVSKPDYEANARSVAGIARALMLTSDQYVGLDENYGQLYAVALGTTTTSGLYSPATPTQAQLDSIKSYIESTKPQTITFRFDVLAAPYNTIDVTARLWLSEGANASTVDSAIRLALADFFAAANADGTPTETVDFGYNYTDELGDSDPYVAWSDLFGAILDVAGVRKIDEDAFIPVDDVPLLPAEFPKLGTVTLINARTGLALV